MSKSLDYENDTLFDSDDEVTPLPKSNVLQYKLADGSTVTVRPSGTEPKIKFYFSAKSGSPQETDMKLDKMIDDLIPGVKNFIDMRIRNVKLDFLITSHPVFHTEFLNSSCISLNFSFRKQFKSL